MDMNGGKNAVKALSFGWHLGFIGLLLSSASNVTDIIAAHAANRPVGNPAVLMAIVFVGIGLLAITVAAILRDILSVLVKQGLSWVLSAIALLLAIYRIFQTSSAMNWAWLIMIAAFAISMQAALELLMFIKDGAEKALAQAQSGLPDLQELQSELAQMRREYEASEGGGEGREDQDTTDQRT